MLYGIISCNSSHLCHLAVSLLHEPFENSVFLITQFTLFNCVDEFFYLLARHRNYIFQRVHLRPQAGIVLFRSVRKRAMNIKTTLLAFHNLIKAVLSPPNCWLLACQEFIHLFEIVSSDFVNYNRLQPSALPLSLRFEKNSKYFIFSIAFFIMSARNVDILT